MEKRTATWLAQAGPPLVFLPLLGAALDIAWMGLWIGGAIAAAISVISLLIGLAKASSQPAPPARGLFRWETMTRPLLTILIVTSAAGLAAFEHDRAEHYMTVIAGQAQESCRGDKQCPSGPDGWATDGKSAHKTYARWQYTYFANPARDEFGLWVKVGANVERCAHGGVEPELTIWVAEQCRLDWKERKLFSDRLAP